MKHLTTLLKTFCVGAGMCYALAASAQNIVTDPGFEASADGSGAHPFVAPWVVNDPTGNQPPGVTGSDSNVGGSGAPLAHSGANYANLGFSLDPASSNGTSATFGSLSQLLTTVVGRTYQVSFFLANNDPTPTNFFRVLINGVNLVTNFTNSAGNISAQTTSSVVFPSDGNYRLVTASFTASSTSSNLEFQYRNDNDFWRLDDVSVSAPEGGATLWFLLPAAAGVFILHRSRRVLRA